MEAYVGSTQDLAWHLVGPQMRAVTSWENQADHGIDGRLLRGALGILGGEPGPEHSC